MAQRLTLPAGLTTGGGLRQRGASGLRVEGGGSAVTGATGPGLNVYVSGGIVYVETYDYTGATALPLRFTGSTITLAAPVALTAGLGVFGAAAPASKPTVTGSRGGNAALASLLTALAAAGHLTDGTTA